MDSESIYEYAKVSQTYTHHAMLAGWRGLALVSNLSHVPSVLQRRIHFTLSCLVFVYFKIYFKKWRQQRLTTPRRLWKLTFDVL